MVGRCGGPGFDVATMTLLHGNTSYLNAGSGFVIHGWIQDLNHNIAYGNSGYGLDCQDCSGSWEPLACNDWYSNSAGMTHGVAPGVTDVSLNPLFCDLQKDDAHLSAGSPLLALGDCGLVGALGQGCVRPKHVYLAAELPVQAFSISPNPSHGAVQFSWPGSARPEWVDVYDVTGAHRWGAAIESGRSVLAWTGTDQGGRRLPAGIYYARLTGRGISQTARLVLVQ